MSSIDQECRNPWRQVAWATEFCAMTLNVCGSSVWNMVHVTLLGCRILRWILDVWKILFCLGVGQKLTCPIESQSLVVCLELLVLF